MSANTNPIPCQISTNPNATNASAEGRFRLICPDTSVYSNYDYAMRRKAEILKYKKQGNNSFTSGYSRAIAGNSGVAVTSDPTKYTRVGNVLRINEGVCGGIQCSPTSSCDVPGPKMNICMNPAVPVIGMMRIYQYNQAGKAVL